MSREAEIERLKARVKELEDALQPFAFLDFQNTQEAWEIMFQDRFRDWIDFYDMENARNAMKDVNLAKNMSIITSDKKFPSGGEGHD